MDTSRDLFRWVSPRIKSSRTASQWKQDALNIKEQRLQRQTQLKQRGKKKKRTIAFECCVRSPSWSQHEKATENGGACCPAPELFSMAESWTEGHRSRIRPSRRKRRCSSQITDYKVGLNVQTNTAHLLSFSRSALWIMLQSNCTDSKTREKKKKKIPGIFHLRSIHNILAHLIHICVNEMQKA